MIFYEIGLDKGLEDSIMRGTRISTEIEEKFVESFYRSNQEGIYSCIGYFSIFTGSAAFTSIFLKTTNHNNNRQLYNNLVKACCFWTLCFIFNPSTPSRRLANSGYVTWIFALCYYCWLMVFFLTQHLTQIPVIIDKLNTHQMGAFLLANLLTGMVNMAIDTYKCTAIQAFLVLFVYLAMIAIFLVRKI